MGKLPCTDIEKVEKQIKLIEKDFENKKINMDMVNQLMSLYQKAVEYFSAINSPEFKIYTDKIKELMKTQKINELIDKSNEEKKIIDNNINSQITKKIEKEEKILTHGLNKIKNKLNSFSSKKEKKKHMPKVALSKEDEDGETLDVGSDDEEEEEDEDENENENEIDKKESGIN